MNAIMQSMVEEHGLSPEEAESRLADWEICPVLSHGETVGHVAKNGSEIHTVLYPQHRGNGHVRGILRVYANLIERYVFFTTKIPLDDMSSADLTERAGFRETRRDEQYVYYWMDESTLCGRRKCSTTKSI